MLELVSVRMTTPAPACARDIVFCIATPYFDVLDFSQNHAAPS